MTIRTSCKTRSVPTEPKAFNGHSRGPDGPLLLVLFLLLLLAPGGSRSSTFSSTTRLRVSCQSVGQGGKGHMHRRLLDVLMAA